MTRSAGGPGNRPGDRSGGSQWRPSAQQEESAVQPVRIDISKRAVALVIDFAVSYFVGMIVALIPFVGTFIPMQFAMVIFLLCRDFLFEGRGIGKNLMGIQVIDQATGQPPMLLQSIQRNIVILAPFVVLQVINLVLSFVPIPWLNQAVVNLVNIVGMLYCVVVIPVEAYRVYSRADGIRIGDEIAGTALVESQMDFSHFLPR